MAILKMKPITIAEAADISDLVDAALRGEEVIVKNGATVKLIPDIVKPIPKFGSAKGLIQISEDFDEPIEEFRDYM